MAHPAHSRPGELHHLHPCLAAVVLPPSRICPREVALQGSESQHQKAYPTDISIVNGQPASHSHFLIPPEMTITSRKTLGCCSSTMPLSLTSCGYALGVRNLSPPYLRLGDQLRRKLTTKRDQMASSRCKWLAGDTHNLLMVSPALLNFTTLISQSTPAIIWKVEGGGHEG